MINLRIYQENGLSAVDFKIPTNYKSYEIYAVYMSHNCVVTYRYGKIVYFSHRLDIPLDLTVINGLLEANAKNNLYSNSYDLITGQTSCIASDSYRKNNILYVVSKQFTPTKKEIVKIEKETKSENLLVKIKRFIRYIFCK